MEAWRAGKTTVEISTDLGLSVSSGVLGKEDITFDGGQVLTRHDAEKILRNENACYLFQDGRLQKIQTFSELTNRAYSLYPTPSAPTMLVAGFPMHRIKDIDPYRAAQLMVKTLSPSGAVLDTATGLGYTAIQMSASAHHIITIELDPAAQDIARQNPWSRALFQTPNIQQRIGDSFEIVPTFHAEAFDAILHDPPTMALAGDLYSQEFYAELARVLRRGGKLFHYIGDPASKLGATMTRGVVQRLRGAGFKLVKPSPRAFGVLAIK